MAEQEQPKPRKRRSWLRVVTILLGSIGVLILAGGLYWNWKFHSHSCAKGLGLSLRMYANDHGGWLPHGAHSPEASMSLIYSNDPLSLQWWAPGKHLPKSVVNDALAKDGILSPASCGWHYVEGLREEDPPQLAIAWDKVIGLGHNGNRISGLQHEVVMLDGSSRLILRSEWSRFVVQQKAMLWETISKRTSNDPPIRWSDEDTFGPNKFPPPVPLKR
ncbi:MAG TPA: hypothetical protein VK530_03470 [Candidatus Acidoferrum sp.]|nr:hypothetical protein [Candidatus Acidoferrum sp.]